MAKLRKGNQESSEQILRGIPLPKHGDTYTVISHGDIIDKIDEQLADKGFKVIRKEYTHSLGGEIARGKVYIECDKDQDMGMLFTWQNSYNKQVKFGCAIGGYIYDNNAPMVGTEGLAWIRKHTGDSDDEAWTVIEDLIEHADEHFQSAIAEKERMKAMELDTETYGCVMGALYFEHELVTPTQATLVKNERKKPSVDYTDMDNLWGLYKLLMFGIEGMDIKKWQNSQQKLHHMIMAEYAIAVEEVTSEEIKNAGQATIDSYADQLANSSTAEVLNAVPSAEDGPVKVTETETGVIMEVEYPPASTEEESIDDSPQIDGIPNGNTISDTDEEEVIEVNEDELVDDPAKVTAEATGEEVTDEELDDIFARKPAKEEEKKEEKKAEVKKEEEKEEETFPSPEEAKANVRENTKNYFLKKHDAPLVDYWMENHFTDEMSFTDAEKAFDDYINKGKEETSTKDADAELTSILDNASELSPEENQDALEVLSEIEEPVEILTPEDAKKTQHPKKPEDTFEFPTDLDDPEKLKEESKSEDFLDVKEHEGLTVPADVIEQAAMIEKRMTLLYGGIKPYQTEELEGCVNVTIEDTQESFYIEI